jgi:hypothetical protein
VGDIVVADVTGADVDGLLEDAVSPADQLRQAAFKGLIAIGERDPTTLCARADRLVAMIDSPNAYHRAIGVSLLARAVAGDADGRLDGLFDRWFDRLDDPSLMVARFVAQNTGRVVAARPDLVSSAVRRLTAVSLAGHAPSRAVILADVIDALGECIDRAPDRAEIVRFVELQAASPSPKARAAARSFLKVHER